MPTPTQELITKDLHGAEWRFKHIYRGMYSTVSISTEFSTFMQLMVLNSATPCSLGQPRRHLLTTGWSTFVTSKKLIAGDAFVYLRLDLN